MINIIPILINTDISQLQFILVILVSVITLIEIFIEPRLDIIRTKLGLFYGVNKRRWITIFDKRWFTDL